MTDELTQQQREEIEHWNSPLFTDNSECAAVQLLRLYDTERARLTEATALLERVRGIIDRVIAEEDEESGAVGLAEELDGIVPARWTQRGMGARLRIRYRQDDRRGADGKPVRGAQRQARRVRRNPTRGRAEANRWRDVLAEQRVRNQGLNHNIRGTGSAHPRPEPRRWRRQVSDLQELWNNDREQLRQAREQLATVTAELTDERNRSAESERDYQNERLAHADTRKALEVTHAMLATANKSAEHWHDVNESTRAELAKAEARVKELAEFLQSIIGNAAGSEFLDSAIRSRLEALRG